MVYDPNIEYYYGTESKKQNVTDIVKILGCVSLKINCESKLTIINHLDEKFTYEQGTTIFIDLIAKKISVIPIFSFAENQKLEKNEYITTQNSAQSYKKAFFAITGYYNGWTHYHEILKNACIPYFLHYEMYPLDILEFLPIDLIIKTNLFCESGCSGAAFAKDYTNYLQEWLQWATLNLTTTHIQGNFCPIYQICMSPFEENFRQFLFPLYNNYLQNFQSLLEIGLCSNNLLLLWRQLYTRVDAFLCDCKDIHETHSNIILHDESNLVDIHYLQKTFLTMRINAIILHFVSSVLVIYFVLENYSKLLSVGDVIILENIMPEWKENIKAFIPPNFKQYTHYGILVLVCYKIDDKK
jgi:hypothetical protein